MLYSMVTGRSLYVVDKLGTFCECSGMPAYLICLRGPILMEYLVLYIFDTY